MINFLIISFYFFSFCLNSDLNKMRNLFPLIDKKESSAIALFNISNNIIGISQPLKNAYKAAAQMALAKYKFNPISKLTYFNEGKEKLNDCVLKDSVNIEIRYIRLAVQDHAPSILNYQKNIIQDKKYILQNIHSLIQKDPNLFLTITNYLRLNNHSIDLKK